MQVFNVFFFQGCFIKMLNVPFCSLLFLWLVSITLAREVTVSNPSPFVKNKHYVDTEPNTVLASFFLHDQVTIYHLNANLNANRNPLDFSRLDQDCLHTVGLSLQMPKQVIIKN